MRRSFTRLPQLQQRCTALRAAYATDSSRPSQSDVTENIPDASHKDVGQGKKHMTDKGPYDVQADASHKAHAEKNSGSKASQATSETDTGDHNKRAQEDNPEAPKPVIGMNDERGGKGH